MLPQMYYLTKKISLNFGSQPLMDHEDPNTEINSNSRPTISATPRHYILIRQMAPRYLPQLVRALSISSQYHNK